MDVHRLREFLLEEKIATMPELKDLLGTTVDMTVFRNLRKLDYHSSYSHRGKYYTLDEIALFVRSASGPSDPSSSPSTALSSEPARSSSTRRKPATLPTNSRTCSTSA